MVYLKMEVFVRKGVLNMLNLIPTPTRNAMTDMRVIITPVISAEPALADAAATLAE